LCRLTRRKTTRNTLTILTDIGNIWLNGDQYAAVIGQDPATYFAAINVTVGTTTSVAP
jgi:hypothetical protein